MTSASYQHQIRMRWAAPAASYKSPYRKCAGAMLHRLTRRFRAGALVDRVLRFIASYQTVATRGDRVLHCQEPVAGLDPQPEAREHQKRAAGFETDGSSFGQGYRVLEGLAQTSRFPASRCRRINRQLVIPVYPRAGLRPPQEAVKHPVRVLVESGDLPKQVGGCWNGALLSGAF